MEFLYELTPSWSCATVTENGIRIRALAAEFKDKDEQKRVLEQTIGIFLGFAGVLGHRKAEMEEIAKVLGERFEIRHWTRKE